MNCYAFDKGSRAWPALKTARLRAISIGIACVLACLALGQGSPTTIYVATNGNDNWSGNLSAPNANQTDGPKATLEGAKTKIRLLKQINQLSSAGAQVLFMPGTYRVDTTMTLGTLDSGTATAPIVYKSVSPRGAVFEGGVRVTAWTKLRTSTMSRRFTAAAQRRIYQLSLPAAGVTDYGSLKRRGFYVSDSSAALELSVNDVPMTLAQWPNDGYGTIGGRLSNSAFSMNAVRPRNWKSYNDTWAEGFYANNWGVSVEKITAINRSAGSVTLQNAPPYGIVAGCRYKLVNAPEELDSPGEYYLDRSNGMLYFYPSASLSSSRTVVSTLEGPLLQSNAATYVRFEGFTFRNSRSGGITIYGGSNFDVVNCGFVDLGGNGVYAYPAQDSTIRSCDFKDIGLSGILVYGGTLSSLLPANVDIENNDVMRTSRLVPGMHSGIWVVGVGIQVANNAVHDQPGTAITINGANITVEQNEVFNACSLIGDAGAVYAGRDMRMHGVSIRNNLVRDCTTNQTGPGTRLVSGIYLDDFVSGISVTGNAIVRCTNGLLLGGGRDNIVHDNLYYSCQDSMHVDSRGLTWATSEVQPGGVIYNRLREFSVSTPPWSTTFPVVMSYLGDDLRVPKRNSITVNLFVSSSGIVEDDAFFMTSPNTVTQNASDPPSNLNNPVNYDFGLKAGSAGITIGFIAPNPATMGLYVDSYRLSVPNYR